MNEYYTLGSWDSQGVPNYLDGIDTVEPEIYDRIFSLLPETQNVPNSKPSLLYDDQPRNIIIQSDNPLFNGADVYVSFLFEGAGYKNVVGYYTYPLRNGYKVPTKWNGTTYVPTTYSDRNSVDSNGKSVYKKTIIFPNASLPTWANNGGKNKQAGGGNLLPGSRVKLLYDVSNPSVKFPNNTGIGFFLIPNGWNGSIYNAAERIYTYNTFNTNGYIQTILLYDVKNSDDDTMLVIAFEDIMRPSGDADFNDVIIRVKCTPSYATKDIESALILPDSDAITNNTVVLDRTGMYYQLTTSTITTYYASSASNFNFVHTITMTNIDKQYDILREILKLLDKANGCIVTDDGTLSDDSEERKIYLSITIPKTNLQNYIYIFNAFENRNLKNPNGDNSALAAFQSIYIQNNTNNIKNLSFNITDSNSTGYINNTNFTPKYKNLTTPYAMGDPHIRTIFGKKYDLPNDTNIYTMFDNGELTINAKMDNFYMNRDIEVLKDLTFIRLLSIQIKNSDVSEYIIVDMLHPDCYHIQQDDGNLIESELPELKAITIKKENEVDITGERRANYGRLAKTNTFKLNYVQIETKNLGTVLVELMYIPHRKDFVNSISLIYDKNFVMFNTKGALLSQYQAKTVDSLISK